MTTVQTDSSASSRAPAMDTSGLAAGSLGQRLSELRKERGLTITDVAQVIKYSPRQIEALEGDRFDQLPDAAIIRGFIRNYARLLQMDATDLLAIFNRQFPASTGGIEVPPTTGASLPQTGWRGESLRFVMSWGAAIVLLMAAAVYFLWPAPPVSSKAADIEIPVAATVPLEEKTIPPDVALPSNKMGTNTHDSSSPPSTANPVEISVQKTGLVEKDSALKVQSPPLNVANAVNAANVANVASDPALRQLIFSFDDKSWVEVKDATKRTIFAQSNPPGTRQVVNGKPPFAVVVGNAPHVQLQYEERAIDMQPYTKVDVARFTLE